MRRTHLLTATSGLLIAGSILWAGCGIAQSECLDGTNEHCAKLIGGGSGGSSSSSSMTTASGTAASSSTGMDPGCMGEITEVMSAADHERLISDMCGVFVRADATGATEDGTQAAPYKTLQAAINKAGNAKRVYACSSAPYAEAVTVAAAVDVYGGFTCSDGWVFKTATRSLITGVANTVSLTLTKDGEGAHIEGFKITSANATGKGTSSVAVAADAITATLTECDIEAGDGADGADGVAPTGTVPSGADAPVLDPTFTAACINAAAVKPGASGTTTCSDGTTDGGSGGKGGIKDALNNGDGHPGADGMPTGGTMGKGGAGQDATNLCVAGTVGKNGAPGLPGTAGTSPGTLSLSGFMNVMGSDGTDGTSGGKGQGGGGGGSGKSSTFCPGSVEGNGASGGGGGAGGCGGAGGRAGKAGGSSIALLSLGTNLALTKVTLKSGKGGNGGKGTAGQAGGGFGAGGKGGVNSGVAGSTPGCKGGDGGAGGNGGAGGGGRGGHSIGLAAVGIVPTISSTLGTPGDGGTGGMGAPAGGKGLTGSTCDFKDSTVACVK